VSLASVRIEEPVDGASVTELSFPIKVVVEEFTVTAFGQCDDVDTCGHVQVKLDGDNCDEGSAPHNAAITSLTGNEGTAVVDVMHCRTAMDSRKASLTAELVDDDFEPLSPPVVDEIEVDLQF